MKKYTLIILGFLLVVVPQAALADLTINGVSIASGTFTTPNIGEATGTSIDLTGTGNFGGNVTLDGADPSIVLDGSTAGDTDFWFGVVADEGGDDDDKFQIGDGSTPGTNPFVTVDSDGNVGIGTTGPGEKLEVNGAISLRGVYGSSGGGALLLNDSTGSSGTRASVEYAGSGYSMVGPTGNIESLAFRFPGTNDGVGFAHSVTDRSIQLYTFLNSAHAVPMVFSSTGNVGIGTTTPGYKLEVTGDVYVSGDVSALTFTDRTPYFSGDALAAIKNISGTDGQIDHATLPEFARRTLQRIETETVLGERVPVKPEDAWEEYTETETVYDKDEKGEKIILEMKTVYREKDGKTVAEQEPVYKSQEIQVPKKRLKEGVKLDPATGELYTQESTQIEHVISEEPGRDIGAMVSILTRAVQQLTAKVEALEAVTP